MNIVFLSHRRTGSTWLRNILSEITGYTYEKYEDDCKVDPNKGDGVIYKSHFEDFDRILRLYPPKNYRILTMVRNPRDIFMSMCRHRKVDIDNSLDVFMDCHYSQMKRIVDREYYLVSTYEELLEDTEKALRKILSFLKVSCEKEEITKAISIWDNRNVWNERDVERFGTDKITIGINKWKKELSSVLIEKTKEENNEYYRRIREI